MTRLRILIVDDETNFRNLLCEFMSGKGYQCRQAPDAAKALELIPDFAPNVIVADIKMPVISGIELLKSATKNHPGLKVIIMTGGAGLESAIDAVNYGVAGFFKKPLVLDEVSNAIQSIAAEIQQKFGAKFEHEHLSKENARLRNASTVLEYLRE